MLDFFNRSDKTYLFGKNNGQERPRLVDDKGNSFFYDGGIPKYSDYYADTKLRKQLMVLNPKTHHDVVFYFKHYAEELGSVFDFSANYVLIDNKNMGQHARYAVSFADIKAQKPK